MKVLQVNVRLQEGGAARVALDLHRQLLNSGVESKFAYGWGKWGGCSTAEAEVAQSFQVGQQIQVASNILLHRVCGIDLVPPLGIAKRKLKEAICWADVIHLHVIHSYFLPFTWLMRELVASGKPIVWTAHDFWMLTGRCASAEGCEAWKEGCRNCQSQWNYPPSWLDFSASQFVLKREIPARLGTRLHVVSPSMFVADAIRVGLPELDVRVIPNWIDSEFEMALRDEPMSAAPISLSVESIKVLVVANDLSDPAKVDRVLISRILEIRHVEVHTIGKNSPFVGDRVINHGRISERKRMVEIITSADVAIFTSEKDTFGLVMIEALACGVPVLAVESLAAKEVLSGLGILPVAEINRIVSYLASATLPTCYSDITRAGLREKVCDIYSGGVAVKQYKMAYEDAINGVINNG